MISNEILIFVVDLCLVTEFFFSFFFGFFFFFRKSDGWEQVTTRKRNNKDSSNNQNKPQTKNNNQKNNNNHNSNQPTCKPKKNNFDFVLFGCFSFRFVKKNIKLNFINWFYKCFHCWLCFGIDLRLTGRRKSAPITSDENAHHKKNPFYKRHNNSRKPNNQHRNGNNHHNNGHKYNKAAAQRDKRGHSAPLSLRADSDDHDDESSVLKSCSPALSFSPRSSEPDSEMYYNVVVYDCIIFN